MQKGQVSFDLILAGAVALIIMGSLAALSGEIIEMQTRATIRQQMHSTGFTLASAIESSAALSDAESGTTLIAYDIPGIFEPGEEKLQRCSITIDDVKNEITLTYLLRENVGIEEIVPFAETPAGIDVNPNQRCGEPIEIKRA